ncbi:MAG TPA: nucleotidyltransferase domain-containing protein [archaeon]|nr:nucleotidyltransferase domain-containing protein [archaeon]
METLVNMVVQKIAQKIKPEKIILFGSRARGDSEQESDLDLLIIYNGNLSKREVKLQVRNLFPQPEFSMDLFVLTSEEYERQKKIVSTVGRAAFLEGTVCYG